MKRPLKTQTMTLPLPKQAPLALKSAKKTDVRSQFGALVFRLVNDEVQILLITSRRTKRWIVPKGWPMPGMTPGAAAAQEAWEEAGASGKAWDTCLGLYSYSKAIDRKRVAPCLVMVYPVQVQKLADEYPEHGQRKRKWFSQKAAAERVAEPELAQIIRTFNPKLLR